MWIVPLLICKTGSVLPRFKISLSTIFVFEENTTIYLPSTHTGGQSKTLQSETILLHFSFSVVIAFCLCRIEQQGGEAVNMLFFGSLYVNHGRKDLCMGGGSHSSPQSLLLKECRTWWRKSHLKLRLARGMRG